MAGRTGIAATAGWIDWYNDRLHGSLGTVPPAEFAHTHYGAVNRRSSRYESGTKAVTVHGALLLWLPRR